MALYRFYLFMADGHIGEAREAHCADDAGAITKSAEFIGFYPVWKSGTKGGKWRDCPPRKSLERGVIWPDGKKTDYDKSGTSGPERPR